MPQINVPQEFKDFYDTYFGDKTGVLFPSVNILKEEVPLDNPNAWVQKDWSGDFLYADADSSGSLYIKINDINAPKIFIQGGLKIEGFPFKKVFINSTSQPGKVINMLYGYGARIIPPFQNINSIGAITADVGTKGGLNQVDGDQAFHGYVDIAGANFTHIQIKNPIASGKTVYLDFASIETDALAANPIEGYYYDTDLATLYANSQGLNKHARSAVASIAQLRTQNNAAVLPVVADRFARRAGTPPNASATSDPFDFRDNPIRLDAGRGVVFVVGVAAHTIAGSLQWREK